MVVSARDGRGLNRIGFLAGVDNARFRRLVRPGDQLRLETEVLMNRKMIGKVKGVASVDGEIAAEAEIMFVFDS